MSLVLALCGTQFSKADQPETASCLPNFPPDPCSKATCVSDKGKIPLIQDLNYSNT